MKTQKSAENNKATDTWVFFAVIAFCTLYATIRYTVFKGVEIAHFPLYITNKIISWSGLIFIAISYIAGRRNKKDGHSDFAKRAGLIGFMLIVGHIIISVVILNPAYYPGFYSGEQMNFSAELSMLAGVIALFAFAIPAINSVSVIRLSLHPETWQSRQKVGYAGLLLAAIHTVFMGYSGWLNVSGWPGYLPPITLLSTIIALIPLLLKILKSLTTSKIDL